MAYFRASNSAAITLEEFIALNDEIAALVRTGVPLEAALTHLGDDLPGRLGRITEMLAERLKRGESLAEILEKEPQHFPPVYRAVLLAGLRGGRLPAALESVSRSARRLTEAQRMAAAGFLYPILVVLVAWCVFVFSIGWVLPALLEFMNSFGVPGRGMLANLARLAHAAWFLGPLVPVAVVLLSVIWWVRSSRAAMLQPRASVVVIGWLPWLGRMLKCYRIATFAETLALMVENHVPLPQAIVLAAEATGDPRMIRAAKEIAESLERGEPLEHRGEERRGFPPLLDWLMVTGERHGALLASLRHASDMYRDRGRRLADQARVLVPVLLTVVIGGSITLAYALLLFAPWARALWALSRV